MCFISSGKKGRLFERGCGRYVVAMRVVQINATCGAGSTGKICQSVSKILDAHGIENKILYCTKGSSFSNAEKYTGDRYIKIQALASHISGKYGFVSEAATKKLIHILDKYCPDVIHLHDMHAHNCNLEKLLAYVRSRKIKLYWTFHDCWVFTGYCPYFTIAKCENWKTECHDCPQYRKYSFFFDRSEVLYHKKRKSLENLDLTIITPSQWLADLVSESFLKTYPVKVIHNGIDLSLFHPADQTDGIKERFGLIGKKVLLGVAYGFGYGKGLDTFLELAGALSDDYRIVLVGITEKGGNKFPGNVVPIPRTENQQQLVELYSAADVLLNLTREDNFPTVNLEALACGTPVITMDIGGSPEAIDESCGTVIKSRDTKTILEAIQMVLERLPQMRQASIKKAQEYSQEICFKKYVELYLCAERPKQQYRNPLKQSDGV